MRKKRFLAAVMAASMVFGNSVAALAANDYTVPPAEGELSGSIALEGVVDPDVFRVELPVVSAGDVKTAFDFIMDPQNLIEQTEGARYVSGQGIRNISTNKFDYGTLYFANTSSNGDVLKLSPSSNELKITNKGTMDVNVKLTAKVVSLNDVKLVNTSTISAGAEPSVYLALSGNGTQKAISENGVEMEAVISGNDDAYAISWNTAEEKYEKVASANSTFASFDFALTGASGGDVKKWLAIEDDIAGAQVNVTWMVTPEGYEAPVNPFNPSVIPLTAGTPTQATVTLPAGANGIRSVTYMRPNGSQATAVSGTDYMYQDGKFWFTATFREPLVQNGVRGLLFTVTFDNGDTAQLTLGQP